MSYSAGDLVGDVLSNAGVPGGGAIGNLVGTALDIFGNNPEGGSEPGANVVWNLRATNPPSPEWKIALFLQWLAEHSPATLGPTSPGLWDRSSRGSVSNWNDAYYTNGVNFTLPDGSKPWKEGEFQLDGQYKPIPIPGANYESANKAKEATDKAGGNLGGKLSLWDQFKGLFPAEWVDEKRQAWAVGTVVVVAAFVGLMLWRPWKKKKMRRRRRMVRRRPRSTRRSL